MFISEKALQFLDENARRNDRDWFAAHKEQYRELVEAPMLAVAEALSPTISAIDFTLEVEPRRTLSRIRRDTRFARDKSLFRNSVCPHNLCTNALDCACVKPVINNTSACPKKYASLIFLLIFTIDFYQKKK